MTQSDKEIWQAINALDSMIQELWENVTVDNDDEEYFDRHQKVVRNMLKKHGLLRQNDDDPNDDLS